MQIHRGSIQMVLGILVLLLGVLLLKLTRQDYFWAVIALGAFIGIRGGIVVSELAGD